MAKTAVSTGRFRFPACSARSASIARKVAVERNEVDRAAFAAMPKPGSPAAMRSRSCTSSEEADDGRNDTRGAARDPTDDIWTVAGRRFRSRLIVGTGKYKDLEETAAAIAASGRRDRHGRGAPGQPVRPQGADAAGLRRSEEDHLPAQHRRLPHRQRRGAHAAPGARGRRLEPGEAGGARPAAAAVSRHAAARSRRPRR